MKCFKLIISLIVSVACLYACDDNDSFSSDSRLSLSFTRDTLSLDTVFANTLSAYKTVKIYNHNNDGLRITSVTQKKGYNNSGFLVNVNGSYLDPELNNQITDLEIRKGDSIRVFVEFKPKDLTSSEDMKVISDEVIFSYENGQQQTLYLKGSAWNANKLYNYTVEAGKDTTFAKGRPLVVYGMLTVKPNATLNVTHGATVYFHHDAGINVYGTLNIVGDKDDEVTLRCDRLDSLLQLKYDNVPGKWKGLHFFRSSKASHITYLDLHGSEYGIICDTTALDIDHSTIHNISGVGVKANNTTLSLKNVQLSNARDNCLDIQGGSVTVNSSTLASFYAYTTGRQHAIYFTDTDSLGHLSPLTLKVTNSIITGYDDDEWYYTPYKADSLKDTNISFGHCLIRTPKPSGADSLLFHNVIYENLEDTINGYQMFKTFDTYNFYYDFTPKSSSPAIKAADSVSSESDDRKGVLRKEGTPDMGCFENKEQ